MNLAIAIPDWNSLDSVRHAHSELEAAALVFFALLVLFDVLAHLSKEKEKEKLLEKIGLGFFAVAVLAEIVAYPYGQRNDSLSAQAIVSLDAKLREASTNASNALAKSSESETKAGDALTKAEKAQDSLGKAEDEANKAQAASSNALTLARGARQEADSFEKEIKSATETAAEAKEKVADRHLKPDGKKTVGSKLLRYEGQKLSIISANGDTEISGIAMDIIKALSAPNGAKWILAWTSGVIPTPKSGGIVVEADARAPEKTVKAANALISALRAEGLSVEGPFPQSFPNNIPQVIGGTVMLGSPVYMGDAITMTITKKP